MFITELWGTLVLKQQQKSNNIPCKLCLTPSYLPDIKWSPQTLLNAVAWAVTSPLLRRASEVARRSTLKACFLGFHLDTIAGIRQYPLSFSVLERFEQPSTAQKFTITRKLQDYLQIGPRTHTICFDACPPLREITWRDVTSEMGLYDDSIGEHGMKQNKLRFCCLSSSRAARAARLFVKIFCGLFKTKTRKKNKQ